MSGQDNLKLLFIAGNGRSGSTLLDVALGQLNGFFAVGELRRVWERGLIENRACGCGKPFRDCETWQSVFAEAYGGMDAVDPNQLVTLRDRTTQTKHLPGMWLNGGRRRNRTQDTYLQHLTPLYRALQSVTGCNVIVDASKWPMYAYMLDQLPFVDLYVVHLVRDPRAVAFSWSRKKKYDVDRYLPRQGALKSTFYWLTWNPSIERFWKKRRTRYLFLRYEDFALQPQESIRSIATFVNEPADRLPFLSERRLEMEATHAVAGNLSRHKRGGVDVRLDDEWERSLPWSRKWLVSATTWPWLAKYGYWPKSGARTG